MYQISILYDDGYMKIKFRNNRNIKDKKKHFSNIFCNLNLGNYSEGKFV